MLVTGVNGYIGSHVADQLLEAGYRVRGTTRALEKVKALGAFWQEKFGPNKVEFVVVSDMAAEGAFDDAVKGISNITHSKGSTNTAQVSLELPMLHQTSHLMRTQTKLLPQL